jgi:gluconolactonase
MGADRVMVYEGGETREFFVQQGCAPTAIAPYGDGFLILCHRGKRVVAVDAQGVETRRWESAEDGALLLDPNDATADGEGGVYFSDPGPFSRSASAQGRVMYLASDGTLTRVGDFPLHYPNGVHVKDAALYVSEHLGGRVLRYDIVSPGKLGKRAVLIDFAEKPLPQRYDANYALSGPDGLEVGPDGKLYVAIYGEGRLLKVSRRGKLLAAIEMPTRFLTNVAFSEAGVIATTGAFDNRTPPFPGEVRLHAKP